MRHPLTSTFLVLGYLGLVLAVGFSLYSQYERHTTGLHPNGYATDERRTHPLAATGAGFAVFAGLDRKSVV